MWYEFMKRTKAYGVKSIYNLFTDINKRVMLQNVVNIVYSIILIFFYNISNVTKSKIITKVHYEVLPEMCFFMINMNIKEFESTTDYTSE